MPKDLHDHTRVYSLDEQQGRTRMPKIIEPLVGQPSFLEHALK